MANTPKYNHLGGIVIDMDADEGNVTYTAAVVQSGSGATGPSWSWATQLAKGDMVKMTGDWRVIEATAGDQEILGFCTETPRWDGANQVPWMTAGASATTDYRTVTVELLGLFVRAVTMATGATTSVVGGYVAPHASVQHQWDKDTTANNTYVMKAGAAGAESVVLFGWLGVF